MHFSMTRSNFNRKRLCWNWAIPLLPREQMNQMPPHTAGAVCESCNASYLSIAAAPGPAFWNLPEICPEAAVGQFKLLNQAVKLPRKWYNHDMESAASAKTTSSFFLFSLPHSKNWIQATLFRAHWSKNVSHRGGWWHRLSAQTRALDVYSQVGRSISNFVPYICVTFDV